MTKRPSTKPEHIREALNTLLFRMNRDDAEFPDVCWNVASWHNVQYEALADAYDEYCANK